MTRRLIESAQSGLSRLTSLVIVDDEPLHGIDGTAFAAELASRRAAREGHNPLSSALGKMAGSSQQARDQRQRLAEDRHRTAKADAQRRDVEKQRASDEAFARIKSQAKAGGGETSTAPPRGSASSGTIPPRPKRGEAHLAEHYRTLDLAPGADASAVKAAYRKLMRKYHPDMHAGNPQKQKAATELSIKVTAAYNAISEHLEKTR